ncbi:MAG TPA: glycosyltransferase family 39 protein [Candidatus Omnitrophota bacterium]|nr:glycosyltransferase family 39 protein [Candidatus Omnitrophota bacterium]HNX82467.1 glycosyltransferase family 39 protein [Candidatus Omnitrophota bacterium]HPT06968.1 glycosyltransferase family 39 protein [Candidatus Omnitrophota bacterium]
MIRNSTARFFKMVKKETIGLWVLFLGACAIRFFQFTFFEFKHDEKLGIIAGLAAQKAHFFISHALPSSVGIQNPPLFVWFLGVVGYLTADPWGVTCIVFILNIAALLLAFRYFLRTLPRTFAVIAATLLAFSPSFVFYSSKIWAQCLLPLPMVMFHILLLYLITKKNGWYFVGLTIVACCASQLHMSGFYLFPVLLIIALIFRTIIRLRVFLSACAITILLFSPYLYYLIVQGGGTDVVTFMQTGKNTMFLSVLSKHLQVVSFDFLRIYLADDFNTVLSRSVGNFKYVLYPLSCGLMLLYVSGVVAYVLWLIQKRRFFDVSPMVTARFPVAFQIAGFLSVCVTSAYIVTGIRVPVHYLIVLFPSQFILMGFIANRLWRFFIARVLIMLSIFSTAVLLITTLIFIRQAGGHPYEYGPSYRFLLQIKNAVYANVPRGSCPEFQVVFTSKGKTDSDAVREALEYGHSCPSGYTKVPEHIVISWNKERMAYEYNFTQ